MHKDGKKCKWKAIYTAGDLLVIFMWDYSGDVTLLRQLEAEQGQGTFEEQDCGVHLRSVLLKGKFYQLF